MGARSCGTSVQDTAAGQLGSAGHGGLSPAVTAEDSGHNAEDEGRRATTSQQGQYSTAWVFVRNIEA